MFPSSPFPSPEEASTLHLQLVARVPTAAADICAAFLPRLSAWLTLHFPCIDEQLRVTAAHEALLDYLHHPERFDPSRLDLESYLRMAARFDLRNALARENRHQRRKSPRGVVEIDSDGGNHSRQDEPSTHLEHQESAARLARIVAAVEADCSPEERQALHLLIDGERGTRPFAVVLGLADRPVSEQEREVKKAKDRLKQRLKRQGERHAC